jgi:hypothetical protein
VQPAAIAVRLEGTMAKPNHAKRSRPRPLPARRRRALQQRVEEQRIRRELERWRRG